jgi:hypothetical protein
MKADKPDPQYMKFARSKRGSGYQHSASPVPARKVPQMPPGTPNTQPTAKTPAQLKARADARAARKAARKR